MKIAVVAWGSLVWDTHSLRIVADWQIGGPVLPIEFSRVSRDGRLTLVIDPAHGQPVTTLFARSAFEDIDEAIENLRERENTTLEKIGFVNLCNQSHSGFAFAMHPAACNLIETWAKANNWPAIIWTALTPNFAQKQNKPFTPEAAVAYLFTLPHEQYKRATEYLAKAPETVDTPVRNRFREIRNRGLSQRRQATAKVVLGHKMGEESLPDAPKILTPNSWHGARKKRRSGYQVPGQTAAELGMGLSDNGNLM